MNSFRNTNFFSSKKFSGHHNFFYYNTKKAEFNLMLNSAFFFCLQLFILW